MPFLRRSLVKRGFPDYPKTIEYGDVIRGLPVEEGSATAVYCSHVLEHLTLEEFRRTLRNVHSYLNVGGTFRFVLPDLAWLAFRYVDSDDPAAASHFMRDTYLGVESQGSVTDRFMKNVFGRSAHLWMWDEKNMARELSDAGFIDIRRAAMGDNADRHFADVEDAGRWENCLGMQCKRG